MPTEWFIFWICINAIIGYVIGKPKNSIGASIAASVLLGPIGWLISVVARGNVRRCPSCAEDVKSEAIVCRYCRSELPAIAKISSPATPFLPQTGGGKFGLVAAIAALTGALIFIYAALNTRSGPGVIQSDYEREAQKKPPHWDEPAQRP
jgi:hypothetical protein